MFGETKDARVKNKDVEPLIWAHLLEGEAERQKWGEEITPEESGGILEHCTSTSGHRGC